MIGAAAASFGLALCSLAVFWLIFGATFAACNRLPRDNRVKIGSHVVGLLHAAVVCTLVSSFLLSAEAEPLRRDLYGQSASIQRTFAISLGYFIFDLMWGLIDGDWQFIMHGALCSLCYAFGLYPFLHHVRASPLQHPLLALNLPSSRTQPPGSRARAHKRVHRLRWGR